MLSTIKHFFYMSIRNVKKNIFIIETFQMKCFSQIETQKTKVFTAQTVLYVFSRKHGTLP